MDKESKQNREMPKDPVEKTTGEDKIQDKAKEAIEEKTNKISNEKTKVELKDTKKSEKKEEKSKKTVDHNPDFKYIVRLSNTDINGEKKVIYGITTVKGIGLHMASLITDKTGINRYMKVGDLSDDQVEKLQNAIDNISQSAPNWMLNHRKDYDTGKNIHLIGNDIVIRLRDEINIMKKIRSYKGIRHERGLPVRGQRTRSNNRKGLALGVSRKKEPSSKSKGG